MGLIGAATAGVLALSACEFDGAYDLPLPGSPVGEDNSYEVTAEFDDILNVVPRSPVFVDDVTVGEVTDVERIGWNAKVTMRVRDDVELPDNVIADIRQVSLLGEKYVALEAPTDVPAVGRLSEGDTIEIEATGRNPEVEEVLGALSFLLSGGGVAQLGTITAELNKVMSGRTNELRALLGSLENVVGALDDQKGDIIRALESLNSLTSTLNAERNTITAALDATGPAIKVLGDQETELVQMLVSLDRLGVVGTRVINASRKDLLATLRDLRPVLAALNDAGQALAPGLNLLLSFPFPQEASEVVRGDYANTSIRAELALDNFLGNPSGDPLDLGDLLPDLPLPDLPDLPELPELPELPIPSLATAVKQLRGCMKDGDLTSQVCRTLLRNGSFKAAVTQECSKPKNQTDPVCRVLAGAVKGLVLPDLPGLPDLLGGLPRTSSQLNLALSSGLPSSAYSNAALMGGSS
ncbi:hypothetical protein GCM10027020_10510 [Nocardioides salsibiostraticola]